MINLKYISYNVGNPLLCSHVDAVHAQGPKADQYTGELVLGVIKETNASAIIGRISRTKMDLNRRVTEENAPAILEYRDTINEIVRSKGIVGNTGLYRD